MAFIYAMSDIHGHLDIFKETLENVDLEAKDNKLILLGDYIDRGDKSPEALYFIKELSERYPNQVIALMGNHEILFFDDLNSFYPEGEFSELKKYISEAEYTAIEQKCADVPDKLTRMCMIYKYTTDLIKSKHKAILSWLKTLPYYYETDTQIYVHAGVDEEAGEYWKWGSEDYYFCSKHPHTVGKFEKDIIAGHIGTSTIAGDESYHKVFWDKASHFYIDGTTVISKNIPLLKYDTITKKYSSFEKILNEEGIFSWVEYVVK